MNKVKNTNKSNNKRINKKVIKKTIKGTSKKKVSKNIAKEASNELKPKYFKFTNEEENHHVASKFMCVAFGKLRKWIEHFALIYGTTIIYADKYFPSSKQCSSCHHVNRELTFEKKWTCTSCNTVHDRDENTAINLLNYLIDVLIGKIIRPEATGRPSNTTSGGDNDQIKWAYTHNYAEMYQRILFDIY